MLHYYSFNQYLKKVHNKKIWRIPLSTGYPCPNRINGKTGCTFCDGKSFLPFYLQENDTLEVQIIKGIEAFTRRYKVKDFYGYFQENTNTYGPIKELLGKYETVLSLENMKGLIISTRPDYISVEIVEKISRLCQKYNKDIWIELGLQSVYDKTLKRIDRNHTYKDFQNAVKICNDADIKVTVHMIIGLPGESIIMIKNGIKNLFDNNKIDGIKFRLLEIIPGIKIENDFKKNSIDFLKFDIDSYCSLLCDLLEIIPANVVIMRLLNTPSIKILCKNKENYSKQQILEKINKELERRGTEQGIYAADKKNESIK
jgi:radical SAM protein (TIGR01212 family)